MGTQLLEKKCFGWKVTVTFVSWIQLQTTTIEVRSRHKKISYAPTNLGPEPIDIMQNHIVTNTQKIEDLKK
jgi:hypothetical protein